MIELKPNPALVNTDHKAQQHESCRVGTGTTPSQGQQVQQNNDINSNDCDGNYVHNSQDNSVRNHGGDNRSFVYNSSGEGPDSPATMATMAGFYAPDDSPSANAARVDRQQTQNKDAQKKYKNTSSIAQGAINRAKQNQYINPQAIDKRIAAREQYNRDQSTIMAGDIFGDMWAFDAPNYKSPERQKEVETRLRETLR